MYPLPGFVLAVGSRNFTESLTFLQLLHGLHDFRVLFTQNMPHLPIIGLGQLSNHMDYCSTATNIQGGGILQVYIYIQWNLRTRDTMGPTNLSLVERSSLSRKKK